MRVVSPLVISGLLLAAACAKTGESHQAHHADACAGEGPVVTDAWVRAAPASGGTTAAYFNLCNAGAADVELIGIDTPAADVVELHETTKDANGVASMAPIPGVSLKPKESVSFAPGGKHVMLIGVHDGVAEGGAVTLTLHFNDGSTATVEAPVKSQGSEEPHGH